MTNEVLLTTIPLLPLVGFALNALIALVRARKNSSVPEKLVSFIACLFPILAFVLAIKLFFVLKGDHQITAISTGPLFTWMQAGFIDVSFGFVLDHLSAVMTLVITGVGSLIHIYSTGYMHDDKGFARFFAYLNFFLFFMLILVLGDSLVTLFVGWEGVGLCSYLLIGYYFNEPEKASAGKKAFVVNRIGDFGFLVGIFFILKVFVSNQLDGALLSFAFIQEHKELLAPLATLIGLSLFVGATGKSAQIPLYIWLPDAMAGPTPVSALIHAATMVTAGVYMVARLFFIYEMSPESLHVIASVGLATAFLAAMIAIVQTDIKKVLAYSTVSQLGYMFLALGVGAPQAAIFHVVTHAFFKACMFLGAGSVIHALHHEQNIHHMGGLFKKMPATALPFLVSTIAIAGIPPFAGFFSKDEILWNVYQHAPRGMYLLAVLTAGMTAFYMFRLFTVVFMGKFRGHHEPHHLGFNMILPVAVLGLLAVVGGFLGVPEILHGENHFHHWLGYLTQSQHTETANHGLEMNLMIGSTVWAVAMSLLAFSLYSRNLNWTQTLKQRFAGFYKIMCGKFYVDEIYEFFIVKPIRLISEHVLWKGVDTRLVDGLMVNGSANVMSLTGRLVTLFQTGVLGNYLLFLWLGLFVFLIVVFS